jgi:restriction system protein
MKRRPKRIARLKRVPLGAPDPKVGKWRRELAAGFSRREFVNARELSLDAWLELIENDDVALERNQFPTLQHREEFLKNIHRYPETTIQMLLARFLLATGTYGFDLDQLDYMLRTRLQRTAPWRSSRLLMHYISDGRVPVWEGIHWVLGLLPEHPLVALQVVHAFFMVAVPYISDSIWGGLEDAMAIIRMRYVVARDRRPVAERIVASLTRREFEFLVGLALEQEGFETFVTPPSGDGGVDVWAHSASCFQMAVQCKHSAVVGVEAARELLGEVGHMSNAAALATSGRFTRGVYQKHHRLRLIDGDALITILNGGLGIEWPHRIDRWLAEYQHKQEGLKRPTWAPLPA